MSNRYLSDEWRNLEDAGAVPSAGSGTTATRAARDAERVRRRMPSEDRRVGRKITPTLSRKLVQRLRSICKAEGYVGPDGEGIIASPVIEDLLWIGVEAYERGEVVAEEVEITTVQRRLRSKGNSGLPPVR